MKVSVVILNYNGARWLSACVASVLGSDFPDFEVIVFDNNSADSSLDSIKPFEDKITVARSPRNLGYAGGNNEALELATGDLILFLNVDTLVHPSCLHELVRALSDCDAAVTVPSMLPYDSYPATPITPVREIDTSLDVLRMRCPLHVETVNFASGACFLIERSAIRRVGYLFDTRYFLYNEDVDLSLRLIKAGMKIVYVPSALVWHQIGGTVGTEFGAYFNTRNQFLTLRKHFHSPRIRRRFILPFGLRLCHSFLGLTFRLRCREAIALLRGTVDGLIQLAADSAGATQEGSAGDMQNLSEEKLFAILVPLNLRNFARGRLFADFQSCAESAGLSVRRE